MECIKELENNGGVLPENSSFQSPDAPHRLIKVLIINHRKQVVCDPELDLWTEVLRTFDTEARTRGYLYGLSYINETEYETNVVIEECNTELVAGVIVFATEMQPADYPILEKINKPIVLYDYEAPDGKYNSVCIDNESAVKNSLNLLPKQQSQNLRKRKRLPLQNRQKLLTRNLLRHRKAATVLTSWNRWSIIKSVQSRSLPLQPSR